VLLVASSSFCSAIPQNRGTLLTGPGGAGWECVLLEQVSTYRSDRIAFSTGPSPQAIQKWLRKVGRFDKDAFEPSTALYDSWRQWCEQTHESRPFGIQRFSNALRGVLVRRRNRHSGRGFCGYRLRQSGGSG
jgi:hypothetical protein